MVCLSSIRRGPRVLLLWAIGALWLCSLQPASALDADRAISQYIQTSWTSESGLPQNSVHAVAQTADGFLWFGTEEGLARFDGEQFHIYNRRNTPAFGSDFVQALAAGSDGSLWIGTDSGLTHLERDPASASLATGVARDSQFVTLTSKNGLTGDAITALAEAPDGSLWVSTTQGLNRVQGNHIDSWTTANGLPDNAVNAVALDTAGALWVGTERGLARLDHGRWTRWTTQNGLPGDRVVELASAPDGSIWASIFGKGLVQIVTGRVVVPSIPLPSKEIQALLFDRNGALWMTFDRHGLGRFEHGKLSTYTDSNGLPSSRTTRALFQDREGSLWVGLLDAGIAQLREGKFAVWGKPEGLAGNYVGNMLEAHDGSMWFGTDSNGLTHVLPDGRLEQWDHRRGLPDQAVFSLAQTRDGSLWVGYRRGALARIQNGHVTTFHDPIGVDSSVNSLFEDRDGTLWVGYFGKGLAQFHNGTFAHLTSSGSIPAIAQSPDGAIWVATDGDGVMRLFKGATTRFTAANGLPNNHAMCIDADSNGDIWVGTASGGLSRIRDGHIVNWTPDQGLPDSTIGSVTVDNRGDLWIGGDSGVARIARYELDAFDRTGTRTLHPTLFGTVDGLRSRETLYGSMPSTWKDSSGRLWFATIMGAAVIDPAHIPMNPVVPPVWIESVTSDAHPIAAQNGIRLDSGSHNLEFTFTAPSFVAPQKMNFRYRLNGFDRDWNEAGSRRSAWYTNLPPGNYTFSVIAQNNDGTWNPRGASFNFVLLPALSRTPLAYLLYALFILVTGWYVYAFRMRSILRRGQELTRLVSERTAQLEEEKAALNAARRELHVRATYDSLTNLLNRAAILERLEHEVSRSIRDKTPLGVAIVDLDHFKRINDTYGHLCGDTVIREAADRLRCALRSYDLAGRYGGEEFLILLPGCDLGQVPGRMNHLLEALRARPILLSGEELHLTCSIGATTFRPEHDLPDMLDLLRRADDAMYRAKKSGRNRATIDTFALH